MNVWRILVTFGLLLFLGAGAGAAAFFWQTREEYNELKKQEVASQRRLHEVEERLREQEKTLQRLRTDPAYVEMVIRRRLGYARPEEFIYRFEE